MDLFKLIGTIAINNSDALGAIDETSSKAKGLASQLDSTSSIGSGFGSAIGKGFSAAGSVITRVGGAVMRGVGAVAKAGTIAVAAGAAAYGALTVNAMKAAGSLEQNIGGSEAVFGEYAAGIQQTAKESYATMGTATSDYLQTANKMGALFQGAGFGIAESADLATTTMQRAADVASIMGLDTASAMESIAGAAKGNFTMMDNLGVAINDTTLKNYALEKGIKKSTQQMTTQEKVGLAMEMFMERTAYAAGNYAKENETLAGALGTAKAAVTNFLDGSGGINDLVPALENAGTVITENLIDIMPRLSTGLSEGMKLLAPMIPTMLQTAIPGIAEGVSTLATGFADALPGIVDALVDSAPVLIEGFGEVFESVADSMPQIMSTLTPAIADGLSGALSLVGIEIDSSAIQSTMESIFSGVGTVGTTLKNNFGDLKTIVSDNISNIGTVLSDNGVTIEGFFTGLAETMDTVSEPIEAGINTAMKGITKLTDWATKDGSSLNTVLKESGEGFKSFSEGLTAFLDATGYFIEGDTEKAMEKTGEVVSKGVEAAEKAAQEFTLSNFFPALSAIAEDDLMPDWLRQSAITALGHGYLNLNEETYSTDELKNMFPEEVTSPTITPTVDQSWALELEEQGNQVQAGLVSTYSTPISPTVDTSSVTTAQTAVSETSAEVESLDGKTASPEIDTSSAEEAKASYSGVANAITDLTALGTVALKVNTSDLNQAVAQASQASTDIQAAFEFSLSTPKVNTSSFDAAVEAAGAAAAAITQAFSSMTLSIPSVSGGNVSVGGTVGTEGYASGGVMMKPTAFGINPNTGNIMIGGEAGAEAIAPIDVLQGYVAAAVASQNAAQTSILERMLDGITALNANMGASMRDAMEGVSLSVGKREFGRLVKGVT